MAYGAEPPRADALAHTIYIWPSRELIARSWQWPEAWHEAFEAAAAQLGRLVAVCLLGGLPVSQRAIAMELPSGCIGFSVRRVGTSIYIAVSDFAGPEEPGPDAPGPGGGTRRQPGSADGLILGLRGTGKSFTVVTFCGPLPPIPAGNIAENVQVQPQTPTILMPSGRSGNCSFHSDPETAFPEGMRENRCSHGALDSILESKPGSFASAI